MPGVLGAVGAEDAAALVSSAARPLLREPWQQVRVVPDPGGRVALAFAGERGGLAEDPQTGVSAVVDGEVVVDATVGGDAAARLILDRYLERGLELDAPDGWFAAAVWDPRHRSLTLVADRMGHRSIYVTRRDGVVLFATELKALLTAGVQPRLDVQAWAELLAFEYPLADRCAVDGVRVVMPATTLRIGEDGVETTHERWRFRLEPGSGAGSSSLVRDFEDRLRTAVEKRLDDRTALSLSGGIDSRCLAALLGTRRRPLAAVSYGANGSEDLEIGTEIARRAGLDGRRLALSPGYLAAWAAETVWLSEGQIRCLHSHHLALRGLRAESGADALLIGFGGDPVLRNFRGVPPAHVPLADGLHRTLSSCIGDDLATEVLTPSFARELSGRAREELGRLIGEEEGSRSVRVRQYIWRHSHRRKIFPATELFRDELVPRDPYDDADVVELCRRLPEGWREGGRLQRHFLAQHPALAELRNPKDGLPPALDGRRRVVSAYRLKLAGRARREIEQRLGRVRPRTALGLGDYAAELRGPSAPLLGILLELRTLDRGQLRREGVQRLVTETLDGRARHARSLGMLLTLELFQRLFVDGDARPAVETPATSAVND